MATWYNTIMSQYIDKDFFKFFLGFFAIISVSLVIIIATRIYQDSQITNTVEANTAINTGN